MNVQDFNKKYGEKGGIEKLTKLRALLYSRSYIAKEFGVSNDRVRQWMKELFGSNYDPRPERKEAIILNMIDFARQNRFEDFKFAFKHTEYYKEALEKCKAENIYDIK